MSARGHGVDNTVEARLVFGRETEDRPPAADRLFLIIGLALASWLTIGGVLFAIASVIFHA